MSWACERVNFESLRPARSEDEFQLHLAALECCLAETIVITSREDIKAHVNWRDRFEPYHHQVENLIRFCRMLPVTSLADDVGLGKTISAGLILSELLERKRVQRALVICPAILGQQWVEEMGSKFGIPAQFAKGQQLTDTERVPCAIHRGCRWSKTERFHGRRVSSNPQAVRRANETRRRPVVVSRTAGREPETAWRQRRVEDDGVGRERD
jgi:hypothetical protein